MNFEENQNRFTQQPLKKPDIYLSDPNLSQFFRCKQCVRNTPERNTFVYYVQCIYETLNSQFYNHMPSNRKK